MNLIEDCLQRVCCSPDPHPVTCSSGGGRGGSMRFLFSLRLCLKRRLSPEFFSKKQILLQICNQIQIGTSARSKGSQRELFILKTAFPSSQEVPACAWHHGSAVLGSPGAHVWTLKSVESWLLLPHFDLHKMFEGRGEEWHVPLVLRIYMPHLPGMELTAWVF